MLTGSSIGHLTGQSGDVTFQQLNMAEVWSASEGLECTPMNGQVGLGGSGGVIHCSPA